MYDQATLELIDAAPHFGELDLGQLPKEFTSAYTEIISYRLRLKELLVEEAANHEELDEIFSHAYSIASTYEAYVFLQDERDNYQSAAFISASAHHLCTQIRLLITPELEDETVSLDEQVIDSRLSSAILYFISGYIADASEMIKSVNITGIDSPENRLLLALKQLLTGIIDTTEHNQPLFPDENGWGENIASQSLWALIHDGVNKLLASLTGQVEYDTYEEARQVFDKVIDLAVDEDHVDIDNIQFLYRPIYNGQFYLTKLLKTLCKTLPDVSLISVNTPDGLDDNNWRTQLIRFSSSRPYLWFNHVDAIQSGYLNPGVSSVVSFPTGGGKSTLSELKITTSLLRGQAVIFIVPTLALVDQVARSLKDAFPFVTTKMSMEEFGLDDIEIEVLPDISVMTPESCLVRMSFNPELYENVGLFVFDECHLLHSKTHDVVDKRSIDAMLCLLRILELSPDVDLLLMSAMLANNNELSAWLSSLIQRDVLSLSMNWKPTRQAKGCVVYDSQRIQELYRYIGEAPRTNTGRLTAPAKRMLTAEPYSFFSLNQTWHSNRVADYKLVKLSDENITLGINNFDGLTANRNVVASKLGRDAIRTGIKTLVFAATKRECDSIVKKAAFQRPNGAIIWTSYEQELVEYIELEFGGSEYSYADNGSSGLQHHGLLTREERLLHESLFRRPDGVNLLVATSTLAQGMNLPAELVIIAGNTRFDIQAGHAEELDAHELLNAAGRAGRAGENSTGVVLVVPSKVVSFNAAESKIAQYWNEIKAVFSQSDQCLRVEDPLAHVLDKIHDNPDQLSEDIRYFIHRLPLDENGTTEQFINRTFKAYSERMQNNQEWAEQRINVANDAFARLLNDSDGDIGDTWHDQLSSVSGIPVQHIRQLHFDFLQANDVLQEIEDVIIWYMNWLSDSFERLSSFIRIQTLDQEINNFNNLDFQEKCNYFSNDLLNLVRLWITGTTIRDIEIAIGTDENNLGKCEKARKFSIRVVPEISYAANILAQVYNFHMENSEGNEPESLNIKLLGRLVRIGINSTEKYALHGIMKSQVGRVKVNLLYNELLPYIDDIQDPNDLDELFTVIGRAYRRLQQNI
ncbi:MAG: DEAD/DEAH box helicase [Candidatus Sedimenticola sp. (ex Thyasira tokunagai)]